MRERDYRGLANFERELIEAIDDLSQVVGDLVVEVSGIREILTPRQPSSTRISIMPKTIQVGQTATAHVVATKGDGTPFLITTTDQVSLAAATAADVTFGTPVFNADGSADVPIVGVNADAGDAITATVDGTASQPDTLTITAAAPASVTLTLQ